jgi:hypothetical protein
MNNIGRVIVRFFLEAYALLYRTQAETMSLSCERISRTGWLRRCLTREKDYQNNCRKETHVNINPSMQKLHKLSGKSQARPPKSSFTRVGDGILHMLELPKMFQMVSSFYNSHEEDIPTCGDLWLRPGFRYVSKVVIKVCKELNCSHVCSKKIEGIWLARQTWSPHINQMTVHLKC